MSIILKYIDIQIENNSSHLISIHIKYIYLKTIFIQVNLTMSIIVSASMAK